MSKARYYGIVQAVKIGPIPSTLNKSHILFINTSILPHAHFNVCGVDYLTFNVRMVAGLMCHTRFQVGVH